MGEEIMAEQVATEAPATNVIPAASAPPASEPSGYMQSNGDFGDTAPDVIKSLMEKKQWTNVEQMAAGYTELESFKGGAHTIPEADDAEGWKAINTARGVPETFDKYEYSTDSGIDLSPELMDGFKQMAFNAGYSPAQLKGAIDFQLDAITAQNDIYQQQLEEKAQADVDANKVAYGINYENAMRDADLTANKHGFTVGLEAEGLKGNPIVTKMLNHIANLEAEDGIGGGAPPEPPKSLAQQLEDMKSNPAFMDKFDRGHKALMVEYNDLNRRIAISKQAG
jgi:hypothetical protein